MTAETPTDAIAAALSRLRGRRGPRPGEHEQRREHEQPREHEHGSHDHAPLEHGDHRRGPRGFGPHGRGAPPWMAERARHGAPAVIRMIEALASASAPLGVSEIAEAIGVDQPRASRLVQQGVDRGWVRREADPDDARRTRIALTDDGSRLFRGVRGERREALSTALEAFTPDEQNELARLLTKLADNWR